jgi:hypothetical protein
MLAWIITRTIDCSSFGKSALGHTAGISPGTKPRLSCLGEVGEKLVSRHHNATCREATGSFYMLREGRIPALAPQGPRVYSLWTLIPMSRQISHGTLKINLACVTTYNNAFYLVGHLERRRLRLHPAQVRFNICVRYHLGASESTADHGNVRSVNSFQVGITECTPLNYQRSAFGVCPQLVAFLHFG